MRLLSAHRTPVLFVMLVCTCLLGATRVCAQKAPKLDKDTVLKRTWVRPALAVSTLGGAVGTFSIHHQRGPHVFSVRAALTAGHSFPVSGESAGELGVLYGRALSWQWGHASLSTGVGYIGGGPIRESAGLGVPAQVQVYASVPYAPLGLSIGGTANLNPERSFVGFTFGVVIGDLR